VSVTQQSLPAAAGETTRAAQPQAPRLRVDIEVLRAHKPTDRASFQTRSGVALQVALKRGAETDATASTGARLAFSALILPRVTPGGIEVYLKASIDALTKTIPVRSGGQVLNLPSRDIASLEETLLLRDGAPQSINLSQNVDVKLTITSTGP
jgi:hypothetical protein